MGEKKICLARPDVPYTVFIVVVCLFEVCMLTETWRFAGNTGAEEVYVGFIRVHVEISRRNLTGRAGSRITETGTHVRKLAVGSG